MKFCEDRKAFVYVNSSRPDGLPTPRNHEFIQIAVFGEPKRGAASPKTVWAELEHIKGQGSETCGKEFPPGSIWGKG